MWPLAGKRNLLEMLQTHFSAVGQITSFSQIGRTIANDIDRHAIRNDDWNNSQILERVGFLN